MTRRTKTKYIVDMLAGKDFSLIEGMKNFHYRTKNHVILIRDV
jgi:hypothetical protein